MSAPVALAAMSVPNAVSSSPVKAGADPLDAMFGALFAAFESLTGENMDPESGQSVSANPSPEQREAQPAPENAPAGVPNAASAWIAQIETQPASENAPPSGASDENTWIAPIETPPESAPAPGAPEQPATEISGRDKNTEMAGHEKTFETVAQDSRIAKITQQDRALPPWFIEDSDEARSQRPDAGHPELSAPQGPPEKSTKKTNASTGSIEIAVPANELVALTPNLNPEAAQSKAPLAQPTAPNPAKPNVSQTSDDQTSTRREEDSRSAEANTAPPGAAPNVQLELIAGAARPSAVIGRSEDNSPIGNETPAIASTDAVPSDRTPAPARTELPHNAAQSADANTQDGGSVSQPSPTATTPSASERADAAPNPKPQSPNRVTQAASADNSPGRGEDNVRTGGSIPPASFHPADAAAPIASMSHPAQPPVNSDAPVRVSFSISPQSVETPALDALALRIATRSAEGDRNFSIRLDPPELGRVEISLNVSATGHAQAEFTADKPQTLDLLQRDAPALERALKDAGLNLAGGFAFSLKGENRQGSSWRDMQHGRARGLNITAVDAAAANANLSGAVALAARAYGLATSRLDIRV